MDSKAVATDALNRIRVERARPRPPKPKPTPEVKEPEKDAFEVTYSWGGTIRYWDKAKAEGKNPPVIITDAELTVALKAIYLTTRTRVAVLQTPLLASLGKRDG